MNGTRTILAGRYELGEVIGRGGMGTVYAARDLVLRRSVAVKVLSGAAGDQDPTSVARFEREGRAAAALSHPAVVGVYDAGVDASTRFIVMERVPGQSLAAIVRDSGPLAPDRAARIGAQVANALAAAHAAGLIHRDVTPGNVMVAADGSVKVLDFGIARALDGTALTQGSSVIGTVAYIAPEQALGGRADERSDIYSLGCLLYAMIAGHAPFEGEPAAILHQHTSVPPLPLHPRNGVISRPLDALIMAMLAKSPDERPQSAAEVRDRLTSSLDERPTAPTAPPAGESETGATRVLAQVGTPTGRRGPLIAGGLAAIGLAVALIALAAGGDGSRSAGRARAGTSSATGGRHSPASTASSRASTTSATRSSAPTPSARTSSAPRTRAPAATSNQASQPQTVSGAAGALTALATQDVQSGSIDQHAAQQVTNALSHVLSSFEMGHAGDVQHKLADLSEKISTLGEQSHVTAPAAPALAVALRNLEAALSSASAPSQTPGPGAPAEAGGPPGQGGETDHGGEHPGPAKRDKSP